MSLFERLAKERQDRNDQFERERQNRLAESARRENARRQEDELHRAAQNHFEGTPLPNVLSQLGQFTGGKISSGNDYSSTGRNGYRASIDFGRHVVGHKNASDVWETRYINVTSNPDGSIEISASGGKTIRTTSGMLQHDPVKVEHLIEQAYDSMKPVQYEMRPPKISLS